MVLSGMTSIEVLSGMTGIGGSQQYTVMLNVVSSETDVCTAARDPL
jgi:hypothetical protein